MNKSRWEMGGSLYHTRVHTCRLLNKWLPPTRASQEALAAPQVEGVPLTLRQLLMPSMPVPSTHGSHDVSLQAYMPTRPSLQFDAHAVQLAAAVLPSRE